MGLFYVLCTRSWFSDVSLIETLCPKCEGFSVSFKNLNIYGAPFRYFYFEFKVTFSILCTLCHKIGTVTKVNWHTLLTPIFYLPMTGISKKKFSASSTLFTSIKNPLHHHYIGSTIRVITNSCFGFIGDQCMLCWWPVRALSSLSQMILKPQRVVLRTVLTSSFDRFSFIYSSLVKAWAK